MATRYWIGGTGSQSWASTSNWSTSEGGTGGASVPTTGDTAYVNVGTSNIDSGLAQTGVTLAALYINFSGTIGTSAASLTFTAVTLLKITTVNPIYISGDSSSEIFPSAGPVTYAGGSHVVYNAGTVVFASASTVTTLNNFGGQAILQSGSAALDCSFFIYGGFFRCERSVTGIGQIAVYSGSVVLYGTAITAAVVSVYANSTYYHQSAGTIGNIFLYAGGIASASGAVSPFTVTNSTKFGPCPLFSDAVVTVTYTNPTVKYCTTT